MLNFPTHCAMCGGKWFINHECPPTPRMAAQTTREKQEAFRARMAMLGLREVRGVYLPEELHPALKEYAVNLLEKHKPEGGE